MDQKSEKSIPDYLLKAEKELKKKTSEIMGNNYILEKSLGTPRGNSKVIEMILKISK